MNLFEHGDTCSPMFPCAACELVAWLRGKLKPEDFTELVERSTALIEPKTKPKRAYRRRHQVDAQDGDGQPAAPTA